MTWEGGAAPTFCLLSPCKDLGFSKNSDLKAWSPPDYLWTLSFRDMFASQWQTDRPNYYFLVIVGCFTQAISLDSHNWSSGVLSLSSLRTSKGNSGLIGSGHMSVRPRFTFLQSRTLPHIQLINDESLVGVCERHMNCLLGSLPFSHIPFPFSITCCPYSFSLYM